MANPQDMANRSHASLNKTLEYIAMMTSGHFGFVDQTVIEFYIDEKYHAEMMSNVMQLLNIMSTHDYEMFPIGQGEAMYRFTLHPLMGPRNIVPPLSHAKLNWRQRIAAGVLSYMRAAHEHSK